MAWLMVLQAVADVLQLLLFLPLTPFTYQVVLARAVGTAANNISATTHVNFLDFTVSSLPAGSLLRGDESKVTARESGPQLAAKGCSAKLYLSM